MWSQSITCISNVADNGACLHVEGDADRAWDVEMIFSTEASYNKVSLAYTAALLVAHASLHVVVSFNAPLYGVVSSSPLLPSRYVGT